jgi:S1-C subfamily serine protease
LLLLLGPASHARAEGTSIAPDQQVQDRFSGSADLYRTFHVDVPEGAASLRVELQATEDVDLYVRAGAPITGDWTSEATASSRGPSGEESVSLAWDGKPALCACTYWIHVVRPKGRPDLTFTLVARVTDGNAAGGARPPDAPAEAPPTSRQGASPSGGEKTSAVEDVAGEFRRDGKASGRIPKDGDGYVTYAIHVGDRADSLLVRVVGARRDVDLYLKHGSKMETFDEAHYRANGAQPNEQIYVDDRSDPPLAAGIYYLDVALATRGHDSGTFEIEVRYDAPEPEPPPATSGPRAPLAFGTPVKADLSVLGGKAALFTLEVPASARELHVVVARATRDIDLYLRHGAAPTGYDAGHDHKAWSIRMNEHLVVTRESDPPLKAGTWYLDAASLVDSDTLVTFHVVASLDAPPELGPDLFSLPPWLDAASLRPLERALQATVQVNSDNGSGSGTCVSPRGLVLTNHHVLFEAGELQRENVYVSFLRDFDEPAEELFIAEVVFADADLDLALLRPTTDIHGRPFPTDARLPWLPLGDSNAVRIGEPVLVAGFPATGGFEARTSLSVTAGIASGFTRDAQGARSWIKTDARINAGHSGGTFLSSRHEFIGVPTREQIDDDDEVGYCVPTAAIPAEWRKVIEAR